MAKNAPFELKIFSGFVEGSSRPHVDFEPIRFMWILKSFEIPPKMGLKRGYLAKSASEVPRPSCDILEKFFEDFGDWLKIVFQGQFLLNSTMTASIARFERG